MREWINERTTWVGLLAAAVAGLQAYESGGSLVTVAIAVVSVVALTLKDKQK